MTENAQTSDFARPSSTPEPEYVDCTCGHATDDHDADGCFPACGCTRDYSPASSRTKEADRG